MIRRRYVAAVSVLLRDSIGDVRPCLRILSFALLLNVVAVEACQLSVANDDARTIFVTERIGGIKCLSECPCRYLRIARGLDLFLDFLKMSRFDVGEICGAPR